MLEEMDVGLALEIVGEVSQDNQQSSFRTSCDLFQQTLSNRRQQLVYLREIGNYSPIPKDNNFRGLPLRFGRSQIAFVDFIRLISHIRYDTIRQRRMQTQIFLIAEPHGTPIDVGFEHRARYRSPIVKIGMVSFSDVDAEQVDTTGIKNRIYFEGKGVVGKMVVGIEHGHEIAFLSLLLNGHGRVQLECFPQEPPHSKHQRTTLTAFQLQKQVQQKQQHCQGTSHRSEILYMKSGKISHTRHICTSHPIPKTTLAALRILTEYLFELITPPVSTLYSPRKTMPLAQISLLQRSSVLQVCGQSFSWGGVVVEVLIIFAAPSIKMMLSSLRLTTFTGIGREEEKKLSLILTYLIDMPEATEFIHPVDWQQLELNDYPLVVKHPMNLLKVQDRLKSREYRSVEEVLDHIQLVWDNCKAYNPEGAFFVLADKMERAFKKMIRNYLPSIQVIVPKPANSAPQHPPNPPPQPSHHAPKSQPRPATRAPAPVVSAPSNQNLNSYEEPASVNEQGENIAEPEEVPQSEKNRLHQRLKQLTQQDLAHVVALIQEGCPEGFKQLGGGRYQMLLDCLDLETFRKVNQRMDELLDSDKATAGGKKVKL